MSLMIDLQVLSRTYQCHMCKIPMMRSEFTQLQNPVYECPNCHRRSDDELWNTIFESHVKEMEAIRL